MPTAGGNAGQIDPHGVELADGSLPVAASGLEIPLLDSGCLGRELLSELSRTAAVVPPDMDQR